MVNVFKTAFGNFFPLLPLAAVVVLSVSSCSGDTEPIDWEDPMWTQGFASSSAGLLKDKVTGFMQKGPFLRSATVSLYELDTSLSQTGRSFAGTITDDAGGFEIAGMELVSPYVRLSVQGFYRNEVSGKESVAPVTLNSIVNVKDKSSANANLLTHLEYERVLNLASEGLSVADAKKQAQNEILGVFGISDNLPSSEDISLFGRTE
ncbi:MAG: hypothetical protein FWH22_11640, partial [Fibromonadales bacterium]|nr:hypothetical protein [Fibromonadales bacterium]